MHEDKYPSLILTGSCWNLYEEKMFEQALVEFGAVDFSADRWQQIAACLGKSVEELTEHYNDLVRDINEIDSGRIELPSYKNECLDSSWEASEMAVCNEISFGGGGGGGGGGKPPTKSGSAGDGERKKGTPWTEQEHMLFLIGLKRYGKGDWRSISRNVVITRTPTQVASHAQKYFLRQTSAQKERKRASIHDITTVNNNSVSLPREQSWVPPPSGAPIQPMQDMPMPLASHLPNQEGLIEYQNFGFPM